MSTIIFTKGERKLKDQGVTCRINREQHDRVLEICEQTGMTRLAVMTILLDAALEQVKFVEPENE